MSDIQIAKTINLSNVLSSKLSLSPNNYGTISIANNNKKPLRHFLDDLHPYSQGFEPGAGAYVDNSSVRFIRNSCIDRLNYDYIPNKCIYLNPRHGFSNSLQKMDVLFCKDANIGDSCLFTTIIPEVIYTYSSGVIKLNFKSDEYKYYCLSFLKDDYFLSQLDLATPRGSTFRHSG